jgi:hypothetical protein
LIKTTTGRNSQNLPKNCKPEKPRECHVVTVVEAKGCGFFFKLPKLHEHESFITYEML